MFDLFRKKRRVPLTSQNLKHEVVYALPVPPRELIERFSAEDRKKLAVNFRGLANQMCARVNR
jgi:hypothetical protein